jgi:hypothetical protein
LSNPGYGNALEREPVTQLARVALENKVEQYREQLEQQQYGQQQQARQDAALRQAALQRQAPERTERSDRERADQAQAERARTKAKQQSDLDKLTRKFVEFFGNLEW